MLPYPIQRPRLLVDFKATNDKPRDILKIRRLVGNIQAKPGRGKLWMIFNDYPLEILIRFDELVDISAERVSKIMAAVDIPAEDWVIDE
ncbi:MAG: hypothetical protein KAJ07_04725 [Planctomycetes bacterium]|nr:hypothetical protein [Planctomycetota bacterium]